MRVSTPALAAAVVAVSVGSVAAVAAAAAAVSGGGGGGAGGGGAVRAVETVTDLGALRGRAAPFPFENDADEFRGVPFGQPPVGPLRFAPPEPALNWSGTRDATKYAPDCWAQNGGMSYSPAGMSEDCLYLNVYRPSGCTASDKLPVVVYFYGGGWNMGAATLPVYNGAGLIGAGHKVVVATVNYRLASLGFLASKELRKLAKSGGTGNMGLLDQRLATQFMRRNAAAFCGDPESITVWGESAGAGSISNHLIMPGSKGVFDAAIMDSGPIATWIADYEYQQQAQFDLVAKHVGCDKSSDVVACMQKADARDVIHAPDRPLGKNETRFTSYAPTIDGVEIPDDPWRMAEEGKMHAGVPVLTGSNTNEGTLLVGGGGANLPISKSLTAAEYVTFAQNYFGSLATEILARYPSKDYDSPWWAVTQIITDMAMACSARRTCKWAAKAGSPCFLYEFEHEVDVAKLDPYLGVFHGDDLVFAWALRYYYLSWKEFEDEPIPLPLTPDEHKLQDTVSSWWMTFAKNHNPGNGWPATNATHQPRMGITISPAPIDDWRAKYCDFWDEHWMWK